MNNWFTIDQIDKESYIISEYRHWEETHCYLLNGAELNWLNGEFPLTIEQIKG